MVDLIINISIIRNMSTNDIEPKPSRSLTDPAEIRAYIHPARMKILDLLIEEKLSVSAVARRLDVHPANITHHFKILESAGLIRLVEKRDTGKNLEKLYRAEARSFSVEPAGGVETNKQALVLAILRDNLIAAFGATRRRTDNPAVLGLLINVRLRPEKLASLEKRLRSLVAEYNDRRAPDGQSYTVNVAAYPNETEDPAGREILIR
jgi:DNA-binding transcriptional ArsR family regulator